MKIILNFLRVGSTGGVGIAQTVNSYGPGGSPKGKEGDVLGTSMDHSLLFGCGLN